MIKILDILYWIVLLIGLSIILMSEGFAQTGPGTAGDPYIITTPVQYDSIRYKGVKYYELGNNIDLSGMVTHNSKPGSCGAGVLSELVVVLHDTIINSERRITAAFWYIAFISKNLLSFLESIKNNGDVKPISCIKIYH